MRILAIGDIHGYRTALDALLEAVAPTESDWIICVGDYVDRGPDSRGVLDRLLELQKTGQLIALRGNHEEMMMTSREEPGLLPMWLMNGGEQTLESYAQPGRQGTLDDVPRSQVLRWQKLQPHPAHYSGKTMICGHTVQGSGEPLDLGFAICIDTGIYLPDGKLTCLDVESGEYWQSTATGEINTGRISPRADEDAR